MRQLKRRILITIAILLWAAVLLPAQPPRSGLANVTVLIVRHAEKPVSGRGLSPAGIVRAKKYATFFNPFRAGGLHFRMDALYAGADSAGSIRPRLTLEPLSRATGLPLNTRFSTSNPAALVHALRARRHGAHILIAWRHRKIPALLTAFGADPARLLPGGVWPGSVFDWVVVLHFDADGRVDSKQLIHEPEPLP